LVVPFGQPQFKLLGGKKNFIHLLAKMGAMSNQGWYNRRLSSSSGSFFHFLFSQEHFAMSKLTRRHFIGASAGAAVALTATGRVRAFSPNEKLSVAVIGTGGRGQDHIGGFLSDSRAEVVAVVDVDEEHANRSADAVEKNQGKRPAIYADLRRVFDDKSIAAISTATPNHWHALCGVWAMQAGKDAYIEKPICHNVAEGAALVAAAKKYGRMCQVGTQCRSTKAVREAMEFLHTGGIGEVNFARGLCYKRRKSIGSLGDYPVPSAVNYELWSGPAPQTNPKASRERFHYDWHWQRMYGNGDLGNQGPHQTDIARWGLDIDSHPSKIISYGGRLGYQAEREDPSYIDAGDTANTEVSIYDYGNKCIVFETRGLSVKDSSDEMINKMFGGDGGNQVGVIFHGSDGYLVQRSYENCVAFDKDMNVIKEFKGGGDHYGNFINACLSRDESKLHASAREGHLSAGISHLGNVSYYLGEKNKVTAAELEAELAKVKSLDDNKATLERTVKHLTDNGVDLEKYPMSLGASLEFDPVKEVFTNRPEANFLLGREYQAGFECPSADSV
jgi:predicted dehydrogenase